MTDAPAQPSAGNTGTEPEVKTPARSGLRRWWFLVAIAAVGIAGGQWYSAHRAEQARRKLAATERMVGLEQARDSARAGGERLVAGLAAGKLGEWQRLAVSVRSAVGAPAVPDGPKPLFDEIAAPVFADMERKLRAAASTLAAADADWMEVERVLDAAAAFLPQAKGIEQRLATYLAAPVWGAAATACEESAFAARFALAPMPHLARARTALVADNDAEVAAALQGLGWLYEPERVAKWVGLAVATRREVQRLEDRFWRANLERALRQLQAPPGTSDPAPGAAAAAVSLVGDGPAAWLQAEVAAVEAQWLAADAATDVARWERALARSDQLVRLVDSPREKPQIGEAFDAASSAAGTVAMTAWVRLHTEMQRFLASLWANNVDDAEARARSIDESAAECTRWTAEIAPTKALVQRWEAVPAIHREKAVPDAATVFAAATANTAIDLAAWLAARDAFAQATTAAGELWLAACLEMLTEQLTRSIPLAAPVSPMDQPPQGDTQGRGKLSDDPIEVDKRAIAMALVVDRSFSMGTLLRDGNTKMSYAKTSARRTAEALSAGDKVGVVTFGNKNEGRIELPLTDAADAAKVQAGLAKLRHAQEYTYLLGGLRVAVDALRPVQAGVKHVVVVSDGEFDPNEEFALRSLARGARERDKITVSIITIADAAIGPTFTRMAEGLAREGGGEFFTVDQPGSVPAFVSAEVTRSLTRVGRAPRAGDGAQPDAAPTSEPTPPKPPTPPPTPPQPPEPQPPVPAPTPDLPARIAVVAVAESPLLLPSPPMAWPALGAVVANRATADASTLLAARDAAGSPVLAYANRGLGRVGAFAADLFGGAGAEFRAEPAFPARLAQWVAAVLPSQQRLAPLPLLYAVELAPIVPTPAEAQALAALGGSAPRDPVAMRSAPIAPDIERIEVSRVPAFAAWLVLALVALAAAERWLATRAIRRGRL